MKLSEHVNRLRELIQSAFDKDFSRLGIGKTSQIEVDRLPEDIRPKRHRFEEMLRSHVGETGDYDSAREKLIDELTFTLFNRLAAVKVMEAAGLFPPVLTKLAEHGDRSFGHKAWLEINPHMRSEELEGIREYLKHAFDELGQTLPLYARSYPYALLPDVVSLNEIIDAFNEVERDAQVGEDIWGSDDVLGWTYESYNSVKKQAHKDSKEKTEYHKVSLQSQVYTPRWVVQFLVENSLGKLYLEMFPDSEIKDRFKIANPPATKEREVKPLHEVKVIDPACGSGNFLLYAFDFFYELYLDQIENYGADYEENDIPRLIVEHNLHGVDLDDRAVQLAHLGLFIKAKKKRRTVGQLSFNIVSSDFFLPEYEEVERIFDAPSSVANSEATLTMEQKDFVREIWDELKFAYKFGALIRISERFSDKLKDAQSRADQGDLFAYGERQTHEDFSTTLFANLRTAVEKYAQARGNTFLTSKTRDAITFLELLTTEYDVATANPPYTDSADFGPDLKKFIEANYKKPYKFNTNLYATFIKRCYELTGSTGKVAMVHPPTFMYIKTFEDVRKFMIDKTGIDLFVEWGYLGMFHPSARVDAAMYVLDKKRSEQDSTFIKLNHIYEGKRYDAFVEAYDHLINRESCSNNYTIPQSKLKIIKSWPFIYWISDEFREKFGESCLDSLANVKTGISTGSNEMFTRFWWEIEKNTISSDFKTDNQKWVYFLKGGSYEKWYGNIFLVLKWNNNGMDIKNYPRATVRNEGFYFKEGVSTVKASSKGGDFRYTPPNTIFADGAPSIFFDKELKSVWFGLAVLNSPLSRYAVNCLNPTVNTQIGDLQRLPFVLPDIRTIESIQTLAIRNVDIKKKLCIFTICDPLFISPAITTFKTATLENTTRIYLNYENLLLAQVLLNEAIINEKIFEVYELTEQDKAMVLAKEGESIGGLPVLSEARDAYLAETEVTQEFPLDDIREFIEALPRKEFSEDEVNKVTDGFPTLYQSNNDLEEFCIRHQVNPINVWYWFKQSKVIPQQRMRTLAMEFLADMIREILMEDEDGIIPLVPNAGEKVLLDRIEEKFMEKGFSSAQYSSFDSILGRPIYEYLNNHFFQELSDHLNLFMYLPKTPFIWHLSSGPEQGFDCYLIIYKWNRDGLMRLRSVYVEHRERSLVNRRSDLADNQSAEAQNEKDRIFKQLQEIEDFKAKIDELLAEGYDPILDDGVGKNIAPLQKKKLIPYEVLNAGQLKKYLNADW
jgi:hypothetical protein